MHKNQQLDKLIRMIAKEAIRISFPSRAAGIDLALQMARLWCLYEIGSSPPEEAWSISLMALVNHYLGFAILMSSTERSPKPKMDSSEPRS